LHRAHEAGDDTVISQRLWEPRPFEELYDLREDPQELRNVAGDPSLHERKRLLAQTLRQWIIDTRDSAFLTESEMHRRAKMAGMTPYEMMQDESRYPLEAILATAEAASEKGEFSPESADHPDSAVRYWNLMGAIISEKNGSQAVTLFKRGLDDENIVVRTTAAEGLARIGKTEFAAPVFRELLKETEPNTALFIARSLAISFDDASVLENDIRQARAQYLAPPGSRRPWKDFMYSAFTCWALEWALIKSGLNEYSDFNN